MLTFLCLNNQLVSKRDWILIDYWLKSLRKYWALMSRKSSLLIFDSFNCLVGLMLEIESGWKRRVKMH